MTFAYVLRTLVNGRPTLAPSVYSEDEILDMCLLAEEIPMGMETIEFDCGDGPPDGLEDVLLEQALDTMKEPLLLHMEAEDILFAPRSEGVQVKHPEHGHFPVARRAADLAIVQAGEAAELVQAGDAGYKYLAKTELVPLSFKVAKEYVRRHHRHNAPPQGHKFSIGLREVAGEELVGVMIASTPKARYQNDGFTLEINRVCTEGLYADVCSKLYGAAIRAGKAMGYRRFLTYTQLTETGSSVKAVGFKYNGRTSASECWDRPSRRRYTAKYPAGEKNRWLLAA